MFVRVITCFIAVSSFLSAEVKVFAAVDDNRIALNETVNFKITAEGSEEFPLLDISKVENFTVISGPAQSSSFQWINGKMSSSKTLSWTLIPNSAGSLLIPALDVRVDGKSYRTRPISINVVRSRARARRKEEETTRPEPSKAPLIFLDAEADKEEAFLGEQITVYYRLYTRVNLRQYAVEKKPQGVGFWIEELYAPKQPSLRDTQVGDVRYKVATLYKIGLFPTSVGELVLDPMILNCTIELPSRSRVPSLFDDFFSDPFFKRTKQQIVPSERLKLRIKPVPVAGKPDDYSGAVGEFTIASSLDTAATEVNQAVSYTIELSGTGNLNLFQLDEPDFPPGLEVFNPKITFEKDPFRDDISGTRRWEYVLIPRKEGQYLIPGMELTYFDPETEKWESTSARSHVLDVQRGEATLAQQKGLTKEEVALLDQDIRYIRLKPVRFRSLGQRMIPGLFWWFGLLGVILFVSPPVVRSIVEGRDERVALARSRKALRRARQNLRKVRNRRDIGQIADAVIGYFGDRMGIARTGIDPRSLKGLLDGRVEGELIGDLTEIIELCDRAKYAPVESFHDDQDAAQLATRAAELLKKIESAL